MDCNNFLQILDDLKFILGTFFGFLGTVIIIWAKNRLDSKSKQIKYIEDRLHNFYAPLYIHLLNLSEIAKQINPIEKRIKLASNEDSPEQVEKMQRFFKDWDDKFNLIRKIHETIRSLVTEKYAYIELDDQELINKYFSDSITKNIAILSNPPTISEPEQLEHFIGKTNMEKFKEDIYKKILILKREHSRLVK